MLRWCLIAVLFGISLMMRDTEHPYICLLAICISSLENVYSDILPIFLNWIFWFFAIELYEFFVYYGNQLLVNRNLCKFFLPFHKLSFCFADGFLCCAKLLSLTRSHLIVFAFISFILGDWSKKILLWFTSQNVLHMLSS